MADSNYDILMGIFNAMEPTEGVTSFSCLEPAIKRLIGVRRGTEHIYDPLAKPDLDPDMRIWMWTYVGRDLGGGEWRKARVSWMLASVVPTIWRLYDERPPGPKRASFDGLRAAWGMMGDNDDA